MPVAAAVAGVVGSSALGAMGSRKAAKAQAAGARAGMDNITSSRDAAISNLDSYAQGGQQGFNELLASLGVGGQQSSYQNPMLQQIQEQTMQRMQNRASATGRNSPADMTNIIAQSLLDPAYQMQQQRIGNLTNVAGMGANAAQAQAGYQMQAGSNLAGLQGNLGQANATRVAAPFIAGQSMMNQFSGMMGQGSAGGIPSFGGGGGGGGMYQNTVNTGSQWNQNMFGNGSGFGNIIGAP